MPERSMAYQQLGGLECIAGGSAFQIPTSAVKADPIGSEHNLHVVLGKRCDCEAQQEERPCNTNKASQDRGLAPKFHAAPHKAEL